MLHAIYQKSHQNPSDKIKLLKYKNKKQKKKNDRIGKVKKNICEVFRHKHNHVQ